MCSVRFWAAVALLIAIGCKVAWCQPAGAAEDGEEEAKPVTAVDDRYRAEEGTPLVVEAELSSAGPESIFQTTRLAPDARFDTPVGGMLVDHRQFLCVRFQVARHVRTCAVGGVVAGRSEIFGALVALTGPDDFPDSVDLVTPDVIGHALIPAGDLPRRAAAALSVDLSPGWYALVVGSGRFGATGRATLADAGEGSYEGLLGYFPDLMLRRVSWEKEFLIRSRGWKPLSALHGHFFVEAEPSPTGVLANDRAPRSVPLGANVVRAPNHGRLYLKVDGSFTYVPDRGFLGGDNFAYAASDEGGNRDEGEAEITVEGAGAVPDRYAVAEDQPLRVPAGLGLLANDRGRNMKASLLIPPSSGALNLGRDGSFTYTPKADFHGQDQFFYNAEGEFCRSGPARVLITVQSVPDAPIANDDEYTVKAGTTLRAGFGERIARKIYWAGGNAVYRANVDGTQVEKVAGIGNSEVIAVDPAEGWVYWSEGIGMSRGRILRTLGGASRPQILAPLAAMALALDLHGKKMYFFSYEAARRRGPYTSHFYRADLDGSNLQRIPLSGLERPAAIHLDLLADKLYWADREKDGLFRANLDGSEAELLSEFVAPDQLALDVAKGRMYWVSAAPPSFRPAPDRFPAKPVPPRFRGETRFLWRGTLDGQDSQDIWQFRRFGRAGGLAVDPAGRKVYWTSSLCQTVNRANLDGTQPEMLVGNGIRGPQQIALDQVLPVAYVPSLVANDEEPDDDPIKTLLVEGTSKGDLQLNPDGTFVYAPPKGSAGADRFRYRLTDTTQESNVATVVIRITKS